MRSQPFVLCFEGFRVEVHRLLSRSYGRGAKLVEVRLRRHVAASKPKLEACPFARDDLRESLSGRPAGQAALPEVHRRYLIAVGAGIRGEVHPPELLEGGLIGAG